MVEMTQPGKTTIQAVSAAGGFPALSWVRFSIVLFTILAVLTVPLWFFATAILMYGAAVASRGGLIVLLFALFGIAAFVLHIVVAWSLHKRKPSAPRLTSVWSGILLFANAIATIFILIEAMNSRYSFSMALEDYSFVLICTIPMLIIGLGGIYLFGFNKDVKALFEVKA